MDVESVHTTLRETESPPARTPAAGEAHTIVELHLSSDKAASPAASPAASVTDQDHSEFPKLPESPEATASIFSLLTWWWMGDLLALGSQRPLQHADMYAVLPTVRANVISSQFEEEWAKEYRANPTAPSLVTALRAIFGTEFWFAGATALSEMKCLCCVCGCFLRVCVPPCVVLDILHPRCVLVHSMRITTSSFDADVSGFWNLMRVCFGVVVGAICS
jgi:hypothetical protein